MALKLKRSLSLLEATFYGIGIIIGAGIYALIGQAAASAGNSLWMSFLIGAAIAVVTGLSYAELSSMFPSDAAEFVYVKKAYHSKFLGFLLSWLILVTSILSVSTVALGFAGYFNSLFSSFVKLPIILTAAFLIILLSFVNFYGIKESSDLNILFTSVEITGLLIIIFLAFSGGNILHVNYFEMPNGFKGVFSAAILVFFAYIGFEEVVHISEETKKPKKFIPFAILFAIGITTILYFFVSLSIVSLSPWNTLNVPNPVALATSNSFLGENASLILSLIALFATLSTVLGVLVVTSRMIYGVSKERGLPSILSKIHGRRRTPWIAVIIACLFSILFLFIGNIDTVASITSLGAFITFCVSNLSLIWLRYTHPHIPRPFRVPLNIGKFPILPFAGAVICVFMIFQFEPIEVLAGIAIIFAGALVYLLRKNKIAFVG
jgi:APA family basic amino acid/polyamine antiporter